MENKNGKRVKTVRQCDLPYRTGPIIKKLRKEHKLTQSQLALRIGTTRSSVGNWEACLRAPRIDQYCALANVFDVELSELL